MNGKDMSPVKAILICGLGAATVAATAGAGLGTLFGIINATDQSRKLKASEKHKCEAKLPRNVECTWQVPEGFDYE